MCSVHQQIHSFQMLPISIGCHPVFHQYLFIITSSCEFLPSKHFNFIIWNVNGGREQSVESGTTFSICSTAIPFQIASKPLFLVHTRSWNRCGTICLVTYFSAIVTNITFHIIIKYSLYWNLCHFLSPQTTNQTYQLSSVGVGRGKDGGPFSFHRPEDTFLRAPVIFIKNFIIHVNTIIILHVIMMFRPSSRRQHTDPPISVPLVLARRPKPGQDDHHYLKRWWWWWWLRCHHFIITSSFVPSSPWFISVT